MAIFSALQKLTHMIIRVTKDKAINADIIIMTAIIEFAMLFSV